MIHVQRVPGIFERQAKEFITRCLILDTDASEKYILYHLVKLVLLSSYKMFFM